ncbi:MAG: rhomboid family intramembrane serine protease, partial [Pseudomonadales bacterium]|nr:rhomboid family intramembrane serine protease [Pseudomonadales bacterium]
MRDLMENWITGLRLIAILVVVIWCVEAVNSFNGHSLNSYGIYPRETSALPGILLWAFLHGDLQHLIVNTTPLFVMGFFVASRGAGKFFVVSLVVILVGGLGVWCFGRSAYHIGASGLVFGYFGYLVALGIYERSLGTLAIASLTVFYYGGIIFGVLPGDS